MTIIVEDGTNVPEANSYVTVAELVQYAADRGIDLPTDPAEQEALLIKAMDYLEAYDTRFYGQRLYTDQVLSWPRWYDYREYLVPDTLKKAQMVLAVAAMKVDLFPNVAASTSAAIRKKVGQIEVEYSSDGASTRPSIPQAEALLNSLMAWNGQLKVIRG